jgi:hypothetical protein
MTDDIKAIREALTNNRNMSPSQLDKALAALDRIEAQKPRVPMAMLKDVAGFPPYQPDRIKRIAQAYGVEVTE